VDASKQLAVELVELVTSILCLEWLLRDILIK